MSTASNKMTYVIGAVLLVLGTAVVTAHVTSNEHRFGVARVMNVGREAKGVRLHDEYAHLKATGAGIVDEKMLQVVRGIVDDICSSITYTACRSYYNAKDTDWCKICLAYK
ncbi:unnamed protein product [Agarophyton chilense]